MDRGKNFTAEDLYQILCNDYMADLQILKKSCYDMFKQGYTSDMACLGIQKTYAFKNLVKTQFRHLVNSGLMAKDQTLNQAYRLVSNTIASWAAKRYQEEAMEKYYAKKEKQMNAQNNKDKRGRKRRF
ncbi:MAG: hypothetical protein LUD72_13600 [Bacteroidales bacterium]|nr:hypothetical protein [Bacteroidales bacterium]